MSIAVDPATATDSLASFTADLRAEDLPALVRERVKDIFLDALASAFAGSLSDEVPAIESVARSVAGDSSDSTVIARVPAPAAAAALINGYLITAATVCDVHRPTLCHVMPQVLPPALAIAEERHASGSTLLAALAAGLEVTTRIGLGLNYPAFRARGWHSPGVIGPFGGAASAGRVGGLDRAQMRNALGLAGSQSAGTFAHWGTPTIKFHQSRGALSGLLAARLAETGFSAARDILGAADGGLLQTYSPEPHPNAAVAGLGERWELMNISLRRWPVASSIQAVVTALLGLFEEHPLAFDDIARVDIELSEDTYRMHGELGWDTRFRALLSTRFVTATVAADRRCWLDQFTAERISDPVLDRFAREKVRVVANGSLLTYAAAVTVETTGGLRWVRACAAPKGDPLAPLTREEIVEKFADASHDALSAQSRDDVVATIANVEMEDDASGLIRSLGQWT